MQMKRNERRVDLGADVLPLLYDVARHMRTRADQMARAHGTTRAQWLILLRVEQRVTAGGRRRQIVTRYDDFRPVEGVLLPHKVTLTTDGRVEQQMIMEKIETNPEITRETFTRPQAAAAKEKS